MLFIGLDAASSRLIRHWGDELPALSRFRRTARTVRLDNSLETLPGAIWPEIAGGVGCGKVPLYYHPKQIHTGEARPRAVQIDDVNREDYFWVRASRAGRRTAVVDIPQAVPDPQLNGVQLCEWGLHDRNFEVLSCPRTLLQELRQRYGDHPIRSCDDHGESLEDYERLLDGLIRGVEKKTELLLDLLDRESWDLFACAYGETHCVGHQFWHFHDPHHPLHPKAAPERLRKAIHTIYHKVDEGVGRMLERAGSGASILVMTSHGMGMKIGGPQLLPEVLARLGLSSAPESRIACRIREWERSSKPAPRMAKAVLRAVAGPRRVHALRATTASLREPLLSAHTRAAAQPNNRCGAIRINIRGREPYGRVSPGREREALIAQIRSALHELHEPLSGQCIVERVVTSEEAFGNDHHPDVPDVMVVFRSELGQLETCRSERLGTIHVPLRKPTLNRTGDHEVDSMLWIRHPDMDDPAHEGQGNVLDIAPTILTLLKVPPGPSDGRPLV